MCHFLLRDSRFLSLLLRVDEELAAKRQAQGCACGGKLHVGHYPRKPRGVPRGVWGEEVRRFSFCCKRCRRRATSESVRFLGRRVWLALAVVMVSPRPKMSSQAMGLSQVLAVPGRTLKRWQRWWHEQFPKTAFWTTARGHFMPPVAVEHLPETLAERFTAASAAQQMARLLWFLTPLTAPV